MVVTSLFSSFIPKAFSKISLKTILIVPFVLQIVGTVGLVEYLSFKNQQRSVNELANQLMREASERTQQHLESYAKLSQQIAQLVSDDLELGKVNLNSNNLQTLDSYFLRRIKNFPSVSFIYVGDEKGKFIGAGPTRQNGKLSYIIEVTDGTTDGHYVSYATDNQGRRIRTINAVPNYDPRRRPWYKAAVQKGKAAWSEIYAFIGMANGGLTITAVKPFRSSSGELAGVTAVDLYLNDLSQFLQDLKISPSGQVFIIEPNGFLVASSINQQIYIEENGKLKRLPAAASQNSLIKTAVHHLKQRFGKFSNIQHSQQLKFTVDGQRQFVQVTPWRDEFGLNWLIVAVVPESDFVGRLYTNSRITILLCLSSLVTAVIIGILTARWITAPILGLNEAAKNLAQGKPHQPIPLNRTREVGELAASFDYMAGQLKVAFTALKENEQSLTQFLEAVPVGVTIHQADGNVFYVNQVGRAILGKGAVSGTEQSLLSAVYNIYRAGTNQLYPADEIPALRALRGEKTIVNDLEIHHEDQVIPLEVIATPIFDEQGKITYAITAFQDISERKQTEQLLADYNRTLEQQVRERTLALEQEIAERKRTEEALQKREAELREAQRVAHLGSWEFDILAQKITWSDENKRIFGLSPSQPEPSYDQYLEQLIHPDDRVLIQTAINDMITKGVSCTTDFRILHPNGSVRYVEGKSEAIVNDQGQVIRLRGTTLDITVRKQVEAALRESQHFLQKIADATPQILYLFDLTQGHTLYLNQQSVTILGYSPNEIYQGGPEWLLNHFHPDDRHLCNNLPGRFAILSDDQVLSTEYRFQHKNGEWRWLNTREVVFVRDPSGIPIQILGSVQDITNQKRAEQALKCANLELERLAILDSLTQVANRRRFDDYLTQEWQRLIREQQPLSLILCDVDYFKHYNDHYGHQEGDDCLVQVAQTLNQVVKRSTDLVARYGGEEFAVLLPNTNAEGAVIVAEAILTEIQQLKRPHAQSQVSEHITLSLGIASVIPTQTLLSETLIATADKALYVAKKRGRNQYCIYSEQLCLFTQGY